MFVLDEFASLRSFIYIADESFEEKAMTCARQKRVLAVENDVHFRHSLQVLLETNGFGLSKTLKSDGKFTLLDVTDLPSLLRFESALLSADYFNDAPTIPSFEEPKLTKAFRVVQGIRHIAGQLADPGADMLDYYQGLLLQTLSVIRLRHVTPEKKRHVYLAAALLVERLERW
jgi:hypothetical protein